MEIKKFQSAVDELLAALGKVVNVKAFPYLPVIYSSLLYFLNKGSAYRKAVRAIPVGPRSRPVRNKSKQFIEAFLTAHAPFAAQNGDERERRRVFVRLYPVVGLRDPFLAALFRDELDRGDTETIADEYDDRVRSALEQIPPARGEPRFWEAMDSFVETASGLVTDLARERQIQDLIIARVRRFLGVEKKK